VNYHWSEREILGLRWDRALAYLQEIQTDAGEEPVRREPVLPEEERYDAMLLKSLRERKQNHGRRTEDPDLR